MRISQRLGKVEVCFLYYSEICYAFQKELKKKKISKHLKLAIHNCLAIKEKTENFNQ